MNKKARLRIRRRRRGQLCIEQHPLRRAELECKARARREPPARNAARSSAAVPPAVSSVPRSSAVYAASAAA